ncbi:MAG: lipoyl(octanoyl) transferase LipB, partial [Kiritimatiellae bacterium]|nr:lipoyl(octanoyl) transferase LipB [Kiritimatiellia bacterium]
EPLPYPEAVLLQERLVQARIRDEIPDTLLLLQHPPVITLGRRGRTDFVLADDESLQREGIALHTSSRGGDVTYHAPGQWVLYPILKLGRTEMGTHGYLHALEEIAIRTADVYGIEACRREGKAGGWCEQGKFAAIGFKFTRWVTWHGMSLNVKVDLRGFELIVGCGLQGERVCSFQSVLGASCPDMGRVAETLRSTCEKVLKRSFVDILPGELIPEV